MKLIATSDWHLGNLFHGIDRLPEQRHFLHWLQEQLQHHQADALLVAGDVFDHGNPSAAAQALYYEFLADVTAALPSLQVVITAGNHDSSHRLEAPRALLHRHGVETRGMVHRRWVDNGEEGYWEVDCDNLIIPLHSAQGEQVIVAAVPYCRADIAVGGSYSQAVSQLLSSVLKQARASYPECPLVLMAHMYATGADIARNSSERIAIGGLEQVDMADWDVRPDYFTCGHIHKRQHIWNTDWARYTGSALPMSFAECDYHHGVDLIDISQEGKAQVTFLEYEPQHRLMTLPKEGAATLSELKRLIKQLPDRTDEALGEDSIYLELKLSMEHVKPEDRKAIDEALAGKNAVLCRLQQVIPDLGLSTLNDGMTITSVDDVLNRDPMESLQECYRAKMHTEMNNRQLEMLRSIIEQAKTGNNEEEMS